MEQTASVVHNKMKGNFQSKVASCASLDWKLFSIRSHVALIPPTPNHPHPTPPLQAFRGMVRVHNAVRAKVRQHELLGPLQ